MLMLAMERMLQHPPKSKSAWGLAVHEKLAIESAQQFPGHLVHITQSRVNPENYSIVVAVSAHVMFPCKRMHRGLGGNMILSGLM